jgi:hypothetical protein
MTDMNSTELPTGPTPPTADTTPTAKDDSDWTPLFDALCAEFGHPVG